MDKMQEEIKDRGVIWNGNIATLSILLTNI